MGIKERLVELKSSLPKAVTLVAVSKTKPVTDLMQAYDAGQRIFGENKVQEMAEKYQQMPKDIQWHMIGHLQRNKVKYMAEFVELIHGVDSLKLLTEINKQAKKHNRVINCLLQIKIATEETKFGLTKEEAIALLHSDQFQDLKHIHISGVMGMASFTSETNQIKTEFEYLKNTFDTLKKIQYEMEIISMGMSGDYPLAIRCGSTMVRVGSHIFGARNYN
ncbi:MAG: YggS family pyridoxal phosphate-dependent enzyme [Bacteroidetes bacterium]|nr:YggS family pyridoxal phosphate-dependent enzyme [Bacteroidota bacterium]MDA0859821.1 YggS family pyridoxal phosphate-dependent enzyme [Bacteroidota bacterium]MDA1317593.1 YggS family pyridoxal phosphate-dependent enzyme [Bacteroidota bacterium]